MLWFDVPPALKEPSAVTRLVAAFEKSSPILEIEGVIFIVLITASPEG